MAHEARIVPGLTVEEAVVRYNMLSGILYAEPDYGVHAFATPNDARGDGLLGMHGITNLPAAPPMNTATDVTATGLGPYLYRIQSETP